MGLISITVRLLIDGVSAMTRGPAIAGLAAALVLAAIASCVYLLREPA
jgi:hypothetical protein